MLLKYLLTFLFSFLLLIPSNAEFGSGPMGKHFFNTGQFGTGPFGENGGNAPNGPGDLPKGELFFTGLPITFNGQVLTFNNS